MSFSKLNTITKNLELTDTDSVFAQGISAFRAMFSRAANPFKTDRDRGIWDRGYKQAEEDWFKMQQRWKEADRGTR